MSATVIPKKENGSEETVDNLISEEPKKICVVCGDKALGYNFNAITCESCKAFFRRNALKKKVYNCRFSGNCDITVASRRYCQKCRLRKCFQVGMMPELITVHPGAENNEPQESFWPVSIVRKRYSQDPGHFDPPAKFHVPDRPVSVFLSPYHAQLTLQSAISYEDLTDGSVPPMISVSDQSDYNLPSISIPTRDVSVGPGENETFNVLSTDEEDPMVPLPKSVLMRLIQLCHQASPSPCEDQHRMTAQCKCQCTCRSEKRNSRSVDIEAVEVKESVDEVVNLVRDDQWKQPQPSTPWTLAFQDIDHIMRPTDKQTPGSAILDLVPTGPTVEFPPDIDTWKLFRLEELLSANEILVVPRQKSGPPVSFADAGLAADMMDLAIRRTVSMLKCVSAFNTLSTMDQIALFKGSVRELICLRGMMVYEDTANSFRPVGYPHRYLRLDAMSRKQDGNLNLKSYFDSFKKSWRKCDPIMLCLNSMVLFDPRRPNVADVGSVMCHQQFYKDLLKCYLRTVYSPLEAEAVFKKLLDRLRWLEEHIKDLCPIIHIEMSTRDLEPLLVEIIPSY